MTSYTLFTVYLADQTVTFNIETTANCFTAIYIFYFVDLFVYEIA